VQNRPLHFDVLRQSSDRVVVISGYWVPCFICTHRTHVNHRPTHTTCGEESNRNLSKTKQKERKESLPLVQNRPLNTNVV